MGVLDLAFQTRNNRFLLILQEETDYLQTLFKLEMEKSMKPHSGQSVFGLILLGVVQWIVDHGETCCLSTTELSLETENKHYVRRGLVHFGKLLPDFSLGDCCFPRVQDIQDLWRNTRVTSLLKHQCNRYSLTSTLVNLSHHLLPLKQAVRHELPSPECDTFILKKKEINRFCECTRFTSYLDI